MRYNKVGIEIEEYKSLANLRAYEGKLRIPLPQTCKELEIVSEYIFGMPLHLSKLNFYGSGASYQVLEEHSDTYDGVFDTAAHGSCYDVDAIFWRTVIGRMMCGGIASHCYGQVHVDGHRHMYRLKRLAFDVRNSKKVPDGPCKVRRPFVRLARRLRDGREQNDSR